MTALDPVALAAPAKTELPLAPAAPMPRAGRMACFCPPGAPILGGDSGTDLMGVLQLINNLSGQPFSTLHDEGVAELAKTLAIAFRVRQQIDVPAHATWIRIGVRDKLTNRMGTLGVQLPLAPEAPNQVWTSDITYIATDEGWLYLTAFIDLFSRQVVGWSLREHMQASVVTDALRMAWFRRRPAPGLIVHSDRGSQYCSHEFQKVLKDYGMKSSMSRKGDCWDNAPTESLWSRLKVGRLYGRRYATRRQAMDEVVDWLNFYNHKRLHSTLGYVSPMTFEQRWIAAQQQDRKSA